jgi:hypothetical protein
MAYRTFFSGLGIHIYNIAIQITLAQFVEEFFMLISHLTTEGCVSYGHTILSDNGNIRIELCSTKVSPKNRR